MNFYEKNHVAEDYLNHVAELLADRYHLPMDKAAEAVRESGLASGIEGCGYIAMHYPAVKAADTVARVCHLADSSFSHSENQAHATL